MKSVETASANNTHSRLVAPLPDGPLDIVGDIHGEIDALENLLKQLGYAPNGSHSEDRKLVFVGDLVDGGPDSLAVLRKVRDLVDGGRAQCVLGNHELDLLIPYSKRENHWWTCPAGLPDNAKEKPATPADIEELTTFLEKLPIALKRDDMLVIHACWHQESIERLIAEINEDESLGAYFKRKKIEICRAMDRDGTTAARDEEKLILLPEIYDKNWRAEILPALMEYERREQMENPTAVLTSGIEEPTKKPIYIGGRYRMLDRIPWWNDRYTEDPLVIFGHYWRMLHEAREFFGTGKGPDLFQGCSNYAWLGQNKNLFCVDFGVAGRPRLREKKEELSICPLVALRTPEWEVVHDDGTVIQLDQPGVLSG